MLPTYILLFMPITCLAINVWAMAHPSSMVQLIGIVVSALKAGLGVFRRKKSSDLRF
jgi:hypothetical protein